MKYSLLLISFLDINIMIRILKIKFYKDLYSI